MLTKPEIACAIIEGISSVREEEELQDFVVEVEDKEFKCHRLILSACSGFFRGLLRSGMKESQKQRTKLEGVSMETFDAILETLYTGCDNLTRDNMLNVWLAADQLQITVVFNNCVNFITNNICNETVISVWEVACQLQHKNIIEICETFLLNNISLEIWNIIYETANKLGSDLILSLVRDFIKKNYEQVIKSNPFLCLHEKDLLEIIKCQDLVVSTEDVVIESILNWVNNASKIGYDRMSAALKENESVFLSSEEEEKEEAEERIVAEEEGNMENFGIKKQPLNEYRKKCLENLLTETRICHVNSYILENLLREPFIMDNKITREIVMDAALYKSVGRQHGQCLKRAIHRSCSGLENVGVVGSRDGYFFALSCYPKFKWYKLPKCPYLETSTTVKLIAYMTDFFAIGDLPKNSSCLCVFVHNDWRKVKQLPGKEWLGVAVEEFIYLINSCNKQIKRFDPRLGNCLIEDLICFPTQDKIEHICSFDLFILAFCSEVLKGVDETAVHCLDTMSQTWTRLQSLEGSVKNMVSFRKENQLYILQKNGNLWEIQRDGCKYVNMKLVEVLWLGEHDLYGAICYNGRLYIKGSKKYEVKIVRLSSTVFPNFVFNYDGCIRSNIVPVTLEKSNFI